MNFTPLSEFRQALYSCFARQADALMNVTDALLTDPTARSFVELSLPPCFERRWPSLYAAVADGEIRREALLKLCASFAPPPEANGRSILVLDASNIPRPESDTARDRTFIHVPNLPKCKSPVSIGWSFSTVAVAPCKTSSWTYILDNRRIPSSQSAGDTAAEQLRSIVTLLPNRPVLVADRYYGSACFLNQVKALDCDKLLRIKSNWKVYGAVQPHDPHRPGPPKLDGPIFRCGDPRTQHQPDQTWTGTDNGGHKVTVDCWNEMHFSKCRDALFCLVRVIRPDATGKKRDPKVSWFLWQGSTLPPLSEIPDLYRRRFSIEHAYRFDKQNLNWCAPRFRTPEQFERWTLVVAAARNQLVLARSCVPAKLRPWETRQREPSPEQVHRAMGWLIAKIGTPARPVKTRGLNAPGRSAGVRIERAPRYPVIRKQGKAPRRGAKPSVQKELAA